MDAKMNEMMKQCIKMCQDCATQCQSMLSGTPDQATMDACAKMCADCSKMCGDCADMLNGMDTKASDAMRKYAGLS
jgi:hypothetical protein